jgi:Fe-S cluster assembly iron-binding protein IscA
MSLERNIERSPITITDAAAEKLREYGRSLGDGQYIRVWSEDAFNLGNRFGITIEEAKFRDHSYYINGVEIIINEAFLPQVRGGILDYAENKAGGGFLLEWPMSMRSDKSEWHTKG